MFDVDPYPYNKILNVVASDITALCMAEAEPEKNSVNYKTDAKVPIVWIFTRTSIVNQGKVLVESVRELNDQLNPERIRVIWMPRNQTGTLTNYARDIFEVADQMIKLKDLGRKIGISVRVALAQSWLPKDAVNQDKALRIQRLNLALQVLSFYWFRCRCVNLSTLTMQEKERETVVTSETEVPIPGFDNLIYSPRSYRNMRSDPMEASYFSGRKAREILRVTLSVHLVEPDWEQSTTTHNRLLRIEPPHIKIGAEIQVFPAPAQGGEAAFKAVRDRVRNKWAFEQGLSGNNLLPQLNLEGYPWIVLNIQHTDSSRPLDRFHREPLSRDNMIRYNLIPVDYMDREVTVVEETVENLDVTFSNLPEKIPETRTPAQGRLGDRMRETEPSETEQVSKSKSSSIYTEPSELEEQIAQSRSSSTYDETSKFGGQALRSRSMSDSVDRLMDVMDGDLDVVIESEPNRSIEICEPTPSGSGKRESGARPKTSVTTPPKKSKSTKESAPISPEKKKKKSKVPEPSSESESSSEDEDSSSEESSDSSQSEADELREKANKLRKLQLMMELIDEMDKEAKAKEKAKKKKRKMRKENKKKKNSGK
jgi:hypothetical protein